MYLWREMVDSLEYEQTERYVTIQMKNASWYYSCLYEYHIYPNGDILFVVLNHSYIKRNCLSTQLKR